MNLADVQAVEYWVANNLDKAFDIYIADRVLGEKPGEAPQTPKGCKAIGDTIIIYFSKMERLWIKSPENITVTGQGLFVERASAVRWGCYYSGRPEIDLNWCEMVYQFAGKDVTFAMIPPLDGLLPVCFEKFEFHGDSLVAIK